MEVELSLGHCQEKRPPRLPILPRCGRAGERRVGQTRRRTCPVVHEADATMPPDAPAASIRRLMSGRRIVPAIVWLIVAAVIAIGGAGLVAATTNPPGTAGRDELTAAGDAAASPGLDRAEAELAALTGDVQRLGELGRTGLGALVDSKFEMLDAVVAEGQALAGSIEERSAAIRAELAALPGAGPDEALGWSPETLRRRDVARAALDATQGLQGAWVRLAAGATTANKLTTLLTDHDTIAGKAAASGRAANYAAALKTLQQATAKLDQAKALRNILANTIDVTTLTQWIDRNAEYDAALGHLYRSTIAAKGRITKELRQAALDERKAHDLLPANTSGLVIILAEIGRGGLNQAVIGIEQTKAKLQAAVDALAASEPDASGLPDTPDGSLLP